MYLTFAGEGGVVRCREVVGSGDVYHCRLARRAVDATRDLPDRESVAEEYVTRSGDTVFGSLLWEATNIDPTRNTAACVIDPLFKLRAQTCRPPQPAVCGATS